MKKKKKITKNSYELTEYFSDYNQWHKKWIETDDDLEISRSISLSFVVFVKFLITKGLAKKTIKNHIQNLDLLGGEIIRRLNDDDESYRNLAGNELILKYIDDENGPLLPFWDPNDSTELEYHKAFDGTCRKLYKFIFPPF